MPDPTVDASIDDYNMNNVTTYMVSGLDWRPISELLTKD